MVAGGALSALFLAHVDGDQSAVTHDAYHSAEFSLEPFRIRPHHGRSTAFAQEANAETEKELPNAGKEMTDEAKKAQAVEEYEQQMTDMSTYVQELAKAATRHTERAGALAEQIRHETLDEEISRSTQDLQDMLVEVPWKMRAANPSIQHLYDDREALRALVQEGGRVDPLVEKRMLGNIERHATEALEALQQPITSLKVSRSLYDAANRHAALAPPVIRENEVHLKESGPEQEHANQKPPSPEGPTPEEALEKVIQGEPDANTANTSAGCNCDDQVKCSLQGRSFTWCRVGGGRCAALREDTTTSEAGGADRPSWIDSSGADHRLYGFPGPYPASGTHQQQTGAAWDYCTPSPKPVMGGAPKTAHGGRCAWRGDLYERYARDEAFDSKSGTIDLDKVPTRDRLALEAMQLYKANPNERTLCTETENSKPYAICPVSPDPDNPEASHSGWLADRSWDFCTDRTWKPNPKNDQPPLIPAMPTEKELRSADREAKVADVDAAAEAGAPSPLVTLGLAALPSRARPVAPPIRPPQTLVQRPGLRPLSRSNIQRLSSFLPEVKWLSAELPA